MNKNMICSYIFYGRPIVKKNTAKIYGKKAVYSRAFKSWLYKATLDLRQQRKNEEILEPVHGVFKFIFQDARSEPDITNVQEGVQDLIEKENVIKNDKLFHSIESYKYIGKQYGEPRIELKIFPRLEMPIDKSMYEMLSNDN